MTTREITPQEIPTLLEKAFVVFSIFKTTVGTIPLTYSQLIVKIPALIKFFREARPILEEMLKLVKD